MAKNPNVLPHPQNALNKFMLRILFERDQLERAYNLDGNTISIFKVKSRSGTGGESDDVGGLVDSHLEDMYHSLYGEPFELRKLHKETKTECCMVDSNFAGILIPPLNAMVKVHMSCIEDLRTGKGWNWEAHLEAFEELDQLSRAYTNKLTQMTTNMAGMVMVNSVENSNPKVGKGTAKKKRCGNTKPEETGADTKILSALSLHHGYKGRWCSNEESIGCRKLAELAGVGLGSVSRFFVKKGFNHRSYTALCKRNPKKFAILIQSWRGETPPNELKFD